MEEKLDALQAQIARLEALTILRVKNILTIDEVCILTGLSKDYIYHLTSKKQIPYYKPNGRVIYFDRTEIENWMKQNRQGTQTEAEQMAAAYIAKKSV